MEIQRGFLESVGKTKLIRINSLSDATGCEILAKAEYLNPGGSVKDRTALGIIEEAEAQGLLGPGGTIVEGTAGNTGIGLTLIGNAKRYWTVIVIPETQSKEKIELLKSLGAQVKTVPPAPYSSPDNYNHIAKRLADSIDGGFWANQFDNMANKKIHYKTTGPEIWEQTDGKVTAFVSAVGTGGTIAGISEYLKEKNPKIKTVCADPYGAGIWSWIKYGNLEHNQGNSITEGIGQNRITENLKGALIDDAYKIGDKAIIKMLHYLVTHEGLYLGSSSGINLCGALKLAREGGPGQVIVTILCDHGTRYQSKIYNPLWLAEKNLSIDKIPDRVEEFWDEI